MKVDRHTKTKKSIFCNLEIFRVREKDFPVEVVELKGSSGLASCSADGLNRCLQTQSPISLGSRKANVLPLFQPTTRTSAILDLVSQSKQT